MISNLVETLRSASGWNCKGPIVWRWSWKDGWNKMRFHHIWFYMWMIHIYIYLHLTIIVSYMFILCSETKTSMRTSQNHGRGLWLYVYYIYIYCKHSQASLPLSSYQAGLTSAVKVVALVVWVSPLLRLGGAVWSSCFAPFCMLLSKLFIKFGYSIVSYVSLNGLLALRILNECVQGSPCSDMFRPNESMWSNYSDLDMTIKGAIPSFQELPGWCNYPIFAEVLSTSGTGGHGCPTFDFGFTQWSCGCGWCHLAADLWCVDKWTKQSNGARLVLRCGRREQDQGDVEDAWCLHIWKVCEG